VAEGGHEDPERGGVEQPVGRRPPDGPGQQGPILHEHREPPGQALEERGEAVGVEEADVGRHPVDDAADPGLAPGEQVEEPTEGAEEDHPDGGGHHHEDGRRCRAMPLDARHPEPVGHQEADQGAPEDDVEHHGRADALGPEGEAGIGTGHARLGHQPVAERRPRGRAPGGHVAEGQGREVDPEQAEPGRAAVGKDGVGELRVGDQGGDLEEDAEGQVGHVDVGQRPDLAAVAGQQRNGDVEDEQEDEDGADAESDFPTHERSTVPPSAVPVPAARFSLRHRCRLGHHRPYVGTAAPLGPAMLRTWWRRATRPRARWTPLRPS